MTALRYSILLVAIALAACGGATTDKASSLQIPDPKAGEAQRALLALFANGSTAVVYGGGGGPTDCVDGRDPGGNLVRTCNACEVVLTVNSQGLQLERSLFNIPFRRAVSANQPDIAPLDELSGVWVRASAGQSAVPRTTIYATHQMTTDDVRPLGLSIPGNGSVCLPPGPGTVIGFCVMPDSNAVLDIMTSDQATAIAKKVVGDCTTAPEGRS